MPLTRSDIERIKSLGYSEDYFVVYDEDGIPRLRNVDGHCVFLDPETGACKIYPWRPMGCRLYPLVCVPGVGVTVDPECPLANRIPRRVIKAFEKHVKRLVKEVYGDSVEC